MWYTNHRMGLMCTTSLLLLFLFCNVVSTDAASYSAHFIAPITGSSTPNVYQQWSSAVQMAVDDINAQWSSLGDTFGVTILDNQNLGSRSLSLALQAATDNSVQAVIGTGVDKFSEDAAYLFEPMNLALVSPSTRVPTDTTLTNFFSMSTERTEPAQVVKKILNHFNFSKIGVIHAEDEESIAVNQKMMEILESDPTKEVAGNIVLPTSASSYIDLFQPLTTASANVYIVICPNSQTFNSLVTAPGVGVATGGFFLYPKVWIWVNLNESIVTSSALPAGSLAIRQQQAPAANMTAFIAKVTSSSLPGFGAGAVPLSNVVNVYDSVTTVAKAIQLAKALSGGVTRANVVTALHTSTFEGYSGVIRFDQGGHRNSSHYIVSNKRAGVASETAFTWYNLELDQVNVTQMLWPNGVAGTTLQPSGQVQIWPLAIMTNYVTSGVGVPMSAAAVRSFVRFAVAQVNDAFLPPDTRLSVSPQNDMGVTPEAVRLASNAPQYGLVAILGGSTTETSVAIQDFVSAFGIPQFSVDAPSPALSDKARYPTFFRAAPSDSVQMKAIVDMCVRYGWTDISLISSSDSYGVLLTSTFEKYATLAGVNILRSVAVSESSPSFADSLKLISSQGGANILVALMPPTGLAKLKSAMTELEYKPRAVVVTDQFFRRDWWHLLDPIYDKSTFNGFIGLVPASSRVDQTKFDELTALINAASPTAYAGMLAGYNKSPEWAAYIYDAFHVIGDSIVRCSQAGDDPRNGTQLAKHIRQTNLNLITGKFAFDANQDRVDSSYMLMNMVEGAPVTCGTWSESGTYQSQRSVVWLDGSNNIPISTEPRPREWLKWNSAPGIVFTVLAGTGILTSIVMAVLVLLLRDSPIMRTATHQFLIVMLVGTAIGYGSILTWIGEPKPYICALRIWLPPMGYVIILAPLLAKTWRLHRIFTLGSLKIVPIPLWKLVAIVVVMCAIQIIICIAWISAGTIRPGLINPSHEYVSYVVCETNLANRICTYVTYGFLGFISLIGGYVAFRVRKLPKDFNESRWIGFSIYNTLLFSILIVILGYSLSKFAVTVLILICVCTFAITTGAIAFMMAPKFWDLLLHPEKRSGSGGSGSTTVRTNAQRSTVLSKSNTSSNNEEREMNVRHDYSRSRSKN